MQFIAKNIITILSLLVSIIVSITAYAYNADIKTIKETQKVETEERKNADALLRYDYQNDMKAHQSQHKEEKQDRILRDENFRLYLDKRFDGLEKLIDAKTK